MSPHDQTARQGAAPATPAAPAPAAPASPKKSVVRLLAVIIAGVLAFVLVGGLLVHLQVNQADLLRWQAVSAEIKRWGLYLQVLLLATVVYRWRAVVDWAARRQIVKPHEHQRVLGLRWHAALLGVAYLIMVPIGPTTLWRYLFQ